MELVLEKRSIDFTGRGGNWSKALMKDLRVCSIQSMESLWTLPRNPHARVSQNG